MGVMIQKKVACFYGPWCICNELSSSMLAADSPCKQYNVSRFTSRKPTRCRTASRSSIVVNY